MARGLKDVECAIHKITSHDFTFKKIEFFMYYLGDKNLDDLVDCLILHPDVVEILDVGDNKLTDKTGIKIAQYVAASTTITKLRLNINSFKDVTYLAIAAALRVNTSLRYLDISGNNSDDEKQITAAYVEALRINPNRPVGSAWIFNSFRNDLPKLQVEAKKLGHPSLQLLLCARLDHFTFQIKKKH